MKLLVDETVGYNRFLCQYFPLFIKMINSLHRSSSFKGISPGSHHRFLNEAAKKHSHLPLFSVVLTGKLTNYDVTKSSSDNFPKFPRTVPFVKRRKIAVFKVEYLGRFLTKSCKTLDYDYLDCYLLF